MKNKEYINRIACIGSVNWDVYPNNKGYLGGSASNTAYFLSKLFKFQKLKHFSVFLISLIGTDEYAEKIKETIQSKGYFIDYLLLKEGRSGHTEITLNENRERKITRFPSVLKNLSEYIINKNIFKDEVLESFSLIHIKSNLNTFYSLLERINILNQNKDIVISVDISGILKKNNYRFSDEYSFIFNNFNKTNKIKLNIMLGNEEEWFSFQRICEYFIDGVENIGYFTKGFITITRDNINYNNINNNFKEKLFLSNLEKIYYFFNCELLCVKKGSKGALIFCDGKWYEHKAINIDVIDTTGAGDAFNAGIIFGYLLKKEPSEILKLGVLLGSYNCTVHGAQELNEKYIRENILNSFISFP